MIQKILIFLCVWTLSYQSVFSASGETLSSEKETQIQQTEVNISEERTEELEKVEEKTVTPFKEETVENREGEEDIVEGKTIIPVEEKKVQKVEEIQSDIKILEKEKKRLEFKWNTFRIGNENLGDLIRQDLTQQEKETLEILIVNYTTLKNKWDSDLNVAIERWQNTEKLQQENSELKKKLYQTLIPYIQIDKLSAFKLYIESDISYNEESKAVATEIEEKEVARNERVEEIQEKIEDNAELLREKMRKTVTESLLIKLDEFIAQEKFQSLKAESKILLFERLIEKIILKKDILEATENPTSIIEERIFLYEVVQEILQWYIESWR